MEPVGIAGCVSTKMTGDATIWVVPPRRVLSWIVRKSRGSTVSQPSRRD
jgi:hypothetical protein